MNDLDLPSVCARTRIVIWITSVYHYYLFSIGISIPSQLRVFQLTMFIIYPTAAYRSIIQIHQITRFSRKKLGLVSLEIIPHTPSGDSIVPFFFWCLELNTRLTGNWNVQTLTTASCLFSLGIGEKYGLCRVSKYRRKITVELGRHRDRKPPA